VRGAVARLAPLLALCFLCFLLFPSAALAQASLNSISFQGVLNGADGRPLTSGNDTIAFRFYDWPTNTEWRYATTNHSVAVSGGVASTAIEVYKNNTGLNSGGTRTPLISTSSDGVAGLASERPSQTLRWTSMARPAPVFSKSPAGPISPSTRACDRAVAGILSGAKGLQPGMLMKAEGQPHARGEHPLAMTGRVWCLADASRGPIHRGDRPTTSPIIGHAMKAADETRAPGAVIGKAMTELVRGFWASLSPQAARAATEEAMSQPGALQRRLIDGGGSAGVAARRAPWTLMPCDIPPRGHHPRARLRSAMRRPTDR